MAFNFMYRHVREHDGLVDKYALELLDTMLLMLRASAQDPAALGTAELAIAATNHLLRVVRVRRLLCGLFALCVSRAAVRLDQVKRKAPLLLVENVDRSNVCPSTMDALVLWLFQHTGAQETQCVSLSLARAVPTPLPTHAPPPYQVPPQVHATL